MQLYHFHPKQVDNAPLTEFFVMAADIDTARQDVASRFRKVVFDLYFVDEWPANVVITPIT